MTLLSALAPSMMNSRQTLGSSPRSIRLSMSACTTAAFSVAPSIRASGCLWPSASMPRAATSTRSLPMCSPSIWMTRRSSLDRSDVIHSASRSADSATNRREAADFEVPSPAMTGKIALGQPHRTPELARRHVDQHQVHGPAAKPVFRLCRPPGRQRNFMAVVAAHPRAMHSNLATMEADLSFGPAPAVADAAFATTMRRAGELLCLLAKHLFDGSDPGRQTETVKGAVHILPSRLEAGHERER